MPHRGDEQGSREDKPGGFGSVPVRGVCGVHDAVDCGPCGRNAQGQQPQLRLRHRELSVRDEEHAGQIALGIRRQQGPRADTRFIEVAQLGQAR